jgi:chromosome segregation ATPase
MTAEQTVLLVLGSGGIGGVLVAIINKMRAPEDRRAIHAAAEKDEALGEAAIIGAVASAFTSTTGALREEIERMQAMLNELRTRVVEAEAEIRAAAARETALERLVADQKTQLETSHADVIRLRGERDMALDRVAQLEGENRQLKAVADAAKRLEAKL